VHSIAVIEDDQDARETLVDLLEEHGFRAIGAGSGRVALRLLLDRRVDLLISDFQMPDVDGEELVRSLRATLPYGRDLPVIILSGRERDAWSDPNVAFLVKPPVTEDLVALVRSLIARAKAASS